MPEVIIKREQLDELLQRAVQTAPPVQHTISDERLEKVVVKAIESTLTRIGISPNPLDMQKDFAFLRDLRFGVARLKMFVITSVIGAFISGALGAAWMGFKMKLGK